jgi:hypothetical protein
MNLSLLSNYAPSQDSPSKKKVSFSPNTCTQFIRETEQGSSGGTTSTWYQERHYKAFKADCQKTAEIARDHDLKGFGYNLTYARKDISTRGIEHYVDEERAALRCERRLAAWDLVFDEQLDQYESGAGDYQPQHIAEAYQEVSVGCQLEAHVKALQYLKESEAEHRRESKRCRAPKSYEQCHKNVRSMLTGRRGMKNVYKCNTNAPSMLTRRQGMKNVVLAKLA